MRLRVHLALTVAIATCVSVVGFVPAAYADESWDDDAAQMSAYSDAADLPDQYSSPPISAQSSGITDPAGGSDEVTTAGTTHWTTAFIHGQTQQRSNWCGPAAGTTALTNWHVPGVQQSTLAKEMGTTGLGFTPPWNIPGVLNKHINSYYGWPSSSVDYRLYGNTKSGTLTNAVLWNAATYRIQYLGAVTIILVYSHKIWYPSAPTLEAHYLVIYGFSNNWAGHGAAYLVWDPEGEVHHLSKNDYEGVAYAGHYVVAEDFS